MDPGFRRDDSFVCGEGLKIKPVQYIAALDCFVAALLAMTSTYRASRARSDKPRRFRDQVVRSFGE